MTTKVDLQSLQSILLKQFLNNGVKDCFVFSPNEMSYSKPFSKPLTLGNQLHNFEIN